MLMEEYLPYYNQYRTHLTLNKDSPEERKIQAKPHKGALVVGVPVFGGLLIIIAGRNRPELIRVAQRSAVFILSGRYICTSASLNTITLHGMIFN